MNDITELGKMKSEEEFDLLPRVGCVYHGFKEWAIGPSY